MNKRSLKVHSTLWYIFDKKKFKMNANRFLSVRLKLFDFN